MDYTIDGNCPNGCHKCCADILAVSFYELKKIQKYLRFHPCHSNHANRELINGQYANICPFVTKEGRCAIYIMRPEICRRFTCRDEEKTPFDYSNKRIVSMTEFFFKDEPNIGRPDIKQLNRAFQQKKRIVAEKLAELESKKQSEELQNE